jgi:IS5 family transposase
MVAVVPWQLLVELIEPYYPKPGSKGGLPPFSLETMLRIHLLQYWYYLSDPAMERRVPLDGVSPEARLP